MTEAQRNAKRLPVRCTQIGRSLFDAQDEIDRRREQLIAEIEGKLQQKRITRPLFTIYWTLA